jgi:hypothetical protein
LVTMGGRENIRKRCRRVNIVEILCTYLWKWKNETCWNDSGMEVGGIKENDGEGEFNYDTV